MKYLFLSVLFLGCYNLKKAEKQVVKAHVNYPEVTAKYCSSFYPTKDSTIISTEYIKGDTITSVDTFYTECDSVGQIIPCKQKTKVVVDTFYSSKEVFIENTASTSHLKNTIVSLQNKNAVLEDKNSGLKKWRMIAIGLMLVVGLGVANKIFKFLPF